MKNKPANVRKTPKTLIQDMGESAWLYAKDAQRDFPRNRKLPFEKLLPEALDFLFHTFTDACGPKRLYQGYRLLAVDGSELQIPTDSSRMESYFPGSQTQQDYNLLHMDAFCDLCDGLYVDALIHGRRATGCAGAPPFVHALISKRLEPIRPGCSCPRYRSNSFQIRFVYRMA